MGPKSKEWCPHKRRGFTKTQSRGKRDDAGRDWSNAAVSRGMVLTKDEREPPEPG